MRGSTRCTFTLARRFKALQAVPVTVNGRQTLWVDLRDGLSHGLVAGSPWPSVPWEADEQLVMRRLVRAGDIVFDIGAHIGLHTVLLSELAGPAGEVHAFEPNDGKTDALAMTVASLPNATLHPVALGDAPGRAPLFVPEDESMASLMDWTDGTVGVVSVHSCEVDRLDDLVASGQLRRPDFIKCDTEGCEARIFSGAARTIDCSRAPTILYEANGPSARAFGVGIAAATDLLRSFTRADFRFFHIRTGGELRPMPTFDTGCQYFNLVAVPASRLDRLAGPESRPDQTC